MNTKNLSDHRIQFETYSNTSDLDPLFLHGNALDILRSLPDQSIDCCMTSPPYWGKRQYAEEGIGLEKDYKIFIRDLSDVFLELKRVLKEVLSS